MNNILILGATSDIAISLATIFAKQGHQLTLAGRDQTYLTSVADDLKIRYNIKATGVVFDATDFASHSQFFACLEPKPNLAICVFGYLGDQQKAQNNWDEAQKIIETNYTGAVSILNIISNHFESINQGMIVGISSVAGDRGKMSNFIYGSAKAGFTAYLSGLRNRLYHSGVHVLTVKPGFVHTRMTSGMSLPGPLTASADEAANQILKGLNRKQNIIYTLKRWKLIMMIINFIPEFIFKKLKL